MYRLIFVQGFLCFLFFSKDLKYPDEFPFLIF